MTSRLAQFQQLPSLKRKLSYIVLFLLHSIYRLLVNTLAVLVSFKNYILDLMLGEQHRVSEIVKFPQFLRKVAELPRLPAHVAFIVPDTSGGGGSNSTDSVLPSKIDLHKLAKLISWAWAAHVPLISLYDYYGQIKDLYKELEHILQQQLLRNYLIGKKEDIQDLASLPTIKFYNVSVSNGYSSVTPPLSTFDAKLHIALFTYKDGKSAIVEATRNICSSGIANSKSDPVNESTFNDILSSTHFSKLPDDLPREPDVLVILGDVMSTIGFLPWEIRLSEINWTPSLPFVTIDDLFLVFKKWASTQQRHGT